MIRINAYKKGLISDQLLLFYWFIGLACPTSTD